MQTFFQPAPEIPEYYSDAIRMAFGPAGFFLEFAVTVPSEAMEEPPLMKPVARVRMSPQHALIVARMLSQQVESYEGFNGAINVAEDVRKALGI